jgi:hypothetical protein
VRRDLHERVDSVSRAVSTAVFFAPYAVEYKWLDVKASHLGLLQPGSEEHARLLSDVHTRAAKVRPRVPPPRSRRRVAVLPAPRWCARCVLLLRVWSACACSSRASLVGCWRGAHEYPTRDSPSPCASGCVCGFVGTAGHADSVPR